MDNLNPTPSERDCIDREQRLSEKVDIIRAKIRNQEPITETEQYLLDKAEEYLND